MKSLQITNRLQVLATRRAKLIELNQKHGYTSMVSTKDGLIPNPKEDQYLRLLLENHEEKTGLWLFNQENNKVYASHLEQAKKARVSMTRTQLFNLTSPV